MIEILHLQIIQDFSEFVDQHRFWCHRASCEACVAQWSERWTLGWTARVQVLDGALRCGLKQVASLTLLRLLG